MQEMTPEEARMAFRTMAIDMRPAATKTAVASVEDIEVAGAVGPLGARVYRPEGDGPKPTIALFHGGGFVVGDLDTHDAMARTICAGADAVVVSVDYRLAPEHAFPAAPQDAIAATKDIQARLAELGGSDVLAVAGDSAGGNLSAVAAQQVPGIKAQLLIYPATDLAGRYPSNEENATGYFLDEPLMLWFGANYVGGSADLDVTDPMLAPIHGEVAGLPPAVIVTAELDPLRDQGIAYADALAAAGVPTEQATYAGLIHGFYDMDFFCDAAKDAIADSLGRFRALL
ncbi:alpha/beta hydrolase [Nocardioides montaniterrae]